MTDFRPCLFCTHVQLRTGADHEGQFHNTYCTRHAKPVPFDDSCPDWSQMSGPKPDDSDSKPGS